MSCRDSWEQVGSDWRKKHAHTFPTRAYSDRITSRNVPMMTTVSEELKHSASYSLRALFGDGSVETPINTIDLLGKIIARGPVPPAHMTFRLTDLRKLEAILAGFSAHWDAGTIELIRDANGTSVTRVVIDSPDCAPRSRKRKRLVDEDADSAEEDAPSEPVNEKDDTISSRGSNGLSKEMHEIYAFLQKGTAKGR